MADLPVDMPLSATVEGLILEATQNRLKAMNLPGIEDSKIIIQNIPWMPDDSVPPPYIIVSPAPESTPWQEGTNESDYVSFAVVLSVVLANGRELRGGMGNTLYWRQKIRRKFQNKNIATFTELTLTDGSQLIQTMVESGDKFIEAAKRMQRDASYYVVRFRVKEARE